MLPTLTIPKTLTWSHRFIDFTQKMANRLAFGEARYGRPDPAKDYLRRLKQSVDLFDTTGNLEYLVDAANYCALEFYWSIHPQAHFKAEDSLGRRTRR